jgi:hypothetical protein
MSAPKDRKPPRKPKGAPLPAATVDKAADVTPDDVSAAEAWWRRGQRGKPIADLLNAADDEDAL